MPRRTLPALFPAFASLLIAICSAQENATSCWYPDGTTPSGDVPCNPEASASACCSMDAFCLSNGLCMIGGFVSRGSCTDRSWSDPACPYYCVDESLHGGFSVTPCFPGTPDTWACGINLACGEGVSNFTTGPHAAIALRPYQVAGLETGGEHVLTIEPTTVLQSIGSSNGSSSTASAATTTITLCAGGTGMYTAGQMAGVGVGVGVPLLLALVAAGIIIFRQRRKLARLDSSATSTDASPMQRKQVPSQHTGNDSFGKLYTDLQRRYQSRSGDLREESGEMDTVSHQVNEVHGIGVRPELEGDARRRP